MRAWCVVTLVVSLVGCESPGRFEGTVGGHRLEVRDAVFFPLAGSAGDSALLLLLSEREGLCQALASSQEAPSASSLQLQLFRLDEAGALLAPSTGAYEGTTVVQRAGGFALGSFSRTDDACAALVAPGVGEVVGGQVKIDRLESGDAGRLVGTFELTFGESAEKARGAFDARACPLTALPASPVCL